MVRLRWAVLILGLVLLASNPSAGQDKKEKDDTKVKGAIPAGWKDLNLTAAQKQQVYKVHTEYKSKIDDLEKKIKELKAEEYADKVKVLTDDQKKKLKDTLVPDEKPAEKAYEGKFLKYSDGKLTIKGADDKERDFDVKGVKPLIDGKEGKWDDFKALVKVTVTEKDGKVTKVEGKNP